MAPGWLPPVLALEVTFSRWAAESSRGVHRLIRDMGLANSLWGALRIQGELLKLGIEIAQ